jgi:hypothetical protein
MATSCNHIYLLNQLSSKMKSTALAEPKGGGGRLFKEEKNSTFSTFFQIKD